LREIKRKEAELAERLGQYANLGLDAGGAAGPRPTTQQPRTQQSQNKAPPRSQVFNEDYNIENPRIESEGEGEEDLDAYGEEIMRQMHERQKMGSGPLAAGMYQGEGE